MSDQWTKEFEIAEILLHAQKRVGNTFWDHLKGFNQKIIKVAEDDLALRKAARDLIDTWGDGTDYSVTSMRTRIHALKEALGDTPA